MFRTTLLGTLVVFGLVVSALAGPTRAPASRWASGQIERFDRSSNTFVLRQGTHEMTFVLASDVHVWKGKAEVALGELAAEMGHTAKVSYTVEGGRNSAHRVEVLQPAPAKPRKPEHRS